VVASLLPDGASNKFIGSPLLAPFFVPKTGLPSWIVGPALVCVAAELVAAEGFPRFLSSSFFFSSPTAFNAAVCAASIAPRLELSFTTDAVYPDTCVANSRSNSSGVPVTVRGVHSPFSPASSLSLWGFTQLTGISQGGWQDLRKCLR